MGEHDEHGGTATMAKRNDSAVKIDVEVVTTAKMVAAARGVTLAEYLSEVLRPIVNADLDKVIAERTTQRKPKSSK